MVCTTTIYNSNIASHENNNNVPVTTAPSSGWLAAGGLYTAKRSHQQVPISHCHRHTFSQRRGTMFSEQWFSQHREHILYFMLDSLSTCIHCGWRTSGIFGWVGLFKDKDIMTTKWRHFLLRSTSLRSYFNQIFRFRVLVCVFIFANGSRIIYSNTFFFLSTNRTLKQSIQSINQHTSNQNNKEQSPEGRRIRKRTSNEVLATINHPFREVKLVS